jgi:hypothetical protein
MFHITIRSRVANVVCLQWKKQSAVPIINTQVEKRHARSRPPDPQYRFSRRPHSLTPEMSEKISSNISVVESFLLSKFCRASIVTMYDISNFVWDCSMNAKLDTTTRSSTRPPLHHLTHTNADFALMDLDYC